MLWVKCRLLAATMSIFPKTFLDTKKFKGLHSIPSYTFRIYPPGDTAGDKKLSAYLTHLVQFAVEAFCQVK
jgi:hypothetical protein